MRLPKTIGLRDAKNQFAALVRTCTSERRVVVLERHGHPVAIMLPVVGRNAGGVCQIPAGAYEQVVPHGIDRPLDVDMVRLLQTINAQLLEEMFSPPKGAKARAVIEARRKALQLLSDALLTWAEATGAAQARRRKRSTHER